MLVNPEPCAVAGSSAAAERIIDMHVHIVGNGSGGTGCWIRTPASRWPLQAIMVRHIGLPLSALKGDLDRLFVERLVELVRDSSLDAVVILEKPKLGPHFPKMREALAKSLGVPLEKIHLKAKTNEGVDAVGRGEAIAAHVVATLVSR